MKTETKPFDPTKPYRTRDGREAKIKHTFNDGSYLVVSGIEYWRVPHSGNLYNGEDSRFDLVNIPEKKTIEFWVNVYPLNHYFQTKVEADRKASPDRIACLHFTKEYEEGEGL